MTKFGKAVAVTLTLAASVVGGYYAYKYINENKEEIKKNIGNVEVEERKTIEEFLNDNITYLQFNYEVLNISKVKDDTLYKLLNNPYYFDSNGKLKQKSDDRPLNQQEKKVCVNYEKANKEIYKVTNQNLKIKRDICTTKISITYMYGLKAKITKASKDNALYVINYTIQDIDNIKYIEQNNYEDLGIEKLYKGEIYLKYIDDKYIIISNKVENGNILY